MASPQIRNFDLHIFPLEVPFHAPRHHSPSVVLFAAAHGLTADDARSLASASQGLPMHDRESIFGIMDVLRRSYNDVIVHLDRLT